MSRLAIPNKFDLEQALAGQTVKTKSGFNVVDIQFNDVDSNIYAVSGYIYMLDKQCKWTRDGKKYSDLNLPYDLVMG